MKTVALVFGGKSPEHEISLLSAANVYAAIDKSLYAVLLVYQKRTGEFVHVPDLETLSGPEITMDFWRAVDVAFPVMHGSHCEDGSLQGFFETVGVPYVGTKVLGSAVCMDKDIQKQVARFNGILVTDWLAVRSSEYAQDMDQTAAEVGTRLQYPVFVKPCNTGSSIGICKVTSPQELDAAIIAAFEYDTKVIIERSVTGRELEVAVLGHCGDLVVSGVGEVVSTGGHDFYDYEAKYTDKDGSRIYIPAPDIAAEKLVEIQELSKKIFTVLECNGLARVDYFLDASGAVILNEVNTLPGFTDSSMYPKLFEHAGVDPRHLVQRLIEMCTMPHRTEQSALGRSGDWRKS